MSSSCLVCCSNSLNFEPFCGFSRVFLWMFI
jgi:hypothetical protein